MTNFPTNLDDLTNPDGVDKLSSPSHSGQHTNANDAIEAIQNKLGIDDSEDPNSVDFKLANMLPPTPVTNPEYYFLNGNKEFVEGIHYSCGACQIPTLTDNGNGSATLGSGMYCLSANADGSGIITRYTIAGGLLTLTNLAVNYVVANYNGGTPVIQVISDVNLINETTIIPIYTIFRNGNFLHTQNWDSLSLALVNKIHQSIVKTQRYRRESGLALGVAGTRNITVSSGRVWVGAVPIDLASINTSTDSLYLWAHSAGVWTQSVLTQFNNTQYDNGTNLTALGANRYAVIWVFRGVESQKHTYCVMGTGDYTLAQAESATVPAIPVAISSHAVLIGKIICQTGVNTPTSVQSAFDVQFSQSTAQAHGDLTGRDVADSHPASAISETGSGTVQQAITDLRASSGGSSVWTAVTGTRVTDRTFTVATDKTALIAKGMVFKWKESGVDKLAMVDRPSTYGAPNTTVTLIGDIMTSIDAGTLKYCMMGAEVFEKLFVVAGTLGSVATNIANIIGITEPMRLIGAEPYDLASGSTNSMTFDININGTTAFTNKITLATGVRFAPYPFTADNNKSLALGDYLTLDLDGVHTTPALDGYVKVYLFPIRYLNLA